MNLEIIKYRQINKLTQQQVADKIPISLRTYQRWEKGISVPNLNDLFILASVFDVSIFSLISESYEFQPGENISFYLGDNYWEQTIPDVEDRTYYAFYSTLAGDQIEVKGITYFNDFTYTILPNEFNPLPRLLENRSLRPIIPSKIVTLFFSLYRRLPLIIDLTMKKEDILERVSTINWYTGFVIIESSLCEKHFPEYIEFENVNDKNMSAKTIEIKQWDD